MLGVPWVMGAKLLKLSSWWELTSKSHSTREDNGAPIFWNFLFMKDGCIIWSQDVLCDDGGFASQWKTVCEDYLLQGQASPIALAKGAPRWSLYVDIENWPCMYHHKWLFIGIDFIGVVKPWLYLSQLSRLLTDSWKLVQCME